MHRGIHKVRAGKGEEGSIQKCASVVLVMSLLAKMRIKGKAGVKNFTYLSVRSLLMALM